MLSINIFIIAFDNFQPYNDTAEKPQENNSVNERINKGLTPLSGTIVKTVKVSLKNISRTDDTKLAKVIVAEKPVKQSDQENKPDSLSSQDTSTNDSSSSDNLAYHNTHPERQLVVLIIFLIIMFFPVLHLIQRGRRTPLAVFRVCLTTKLNARNSFLQSYQKQHVDRGAFVIHVEFQKASKA